MTEFSISAKEQEKIAQIMSEFKQLIPLPIRSFIKHPRELEYVGQGFFKMVFKYADKAIKYYRFGPISDQEEEKLTTLSRLESFEKIYMRGERWVATEFIPGKNLKTKDIRLQKTAVEKLAEDMKACLCLGWMPNDLHFGNFLLEPSGRIRCIDVDLFKNIRCYSRQKQERYRQSALERIQGLQKKMLRLVENA